MGFEQDDHHAAPVGLDEVLAARELLSGVVTRTPLAGSRALSAVSGGPVWLKCENLQRTGSFKIRGAYTRIARLSAAERARGVVAASAGNHAQGVALAASTLGIPATVFMPAQAALPKVAATRGYGADVHLVGTTVEDSIAAATEFAERTGAVLVHPFDHPDVIAGQGTVGLEILEQVPDVRCVLIGTGGGGLLGGVAAAVKALRPDVQVIGVQAAGAATWPPSLSAGRPTTLDAMRTIADGIAVGRPGDVTFSQVSALVDDIVTVSEDSLARALLHCLERAKMLVEPAGAATVAALLEYPGRFPAPTVAVLSGGNVDPLVLLHVIQHGMGAAGRYLSVRLRMRDRPGALAELLGLISSLGANVLDVAHSRIFENLPLGDVEVELRLETRGPEHRTAVMAALADAGHAVIEQGMKPVSVWRSPGMPALLLLSFAGFSGYAALLAVAPLWAVRGGADAGGAGLVNAVLLLTTVGAQLFVPAALARYGHRTVLIIGLTLLGLPALGYGLSNALPPVLAMSALRGIGFAVLTVTGSAVTARLVPPDRLGAAIGAYGLAVAAPMVLLLPASVPIFEGIGPMAAFALGALPLLGVPAAVPLGRHMHRIESAQPPQAPGGGRWDLLRGIGRPMYILLSVTVVGGALITFLPQLVGSATVVAVALLLMSLTAAVGRWWIGGWADRVGARRFLTPLLLSTAVALGVVAWWVRERPAVWVLLVAVAVIGIGYGALQNLTLVLAFQAVGPGRINQASAGWNMGFDTGTAFGSLATGYLAVGFSFPVAYAALVAVTLSALLAIPGSARPAQARPDQARPDQARPDRAGPDQAR